MPLSLKEKRSILERRAGILSAARSYFLAHDFLEVETPVRMAAPLPERHIDAIASEGMYLATSPEPHMKRLLAAGYERIFQIAKCFRNGERGYRHNPEFSMLEWYRQDADCGQLIEDTKALLVTAAEAAGAGMIVKYGEYAVRIDREWEVLEVDEAYRRYAGIELAETPDEFSFDRTMVEEIEPRLGRERPTVVYRYPAAFSPMAQPVSSHPARAERFEVYIAGLELANGCVEKTDRDSLIAALKAERAARQALGKDVYPWPVQFTDALETMPASAGTALGIDRLTMLVCNRQDITDVIPFSEY